MYYILPNFMIFPGSTYYLKITKWVSIFTILFYDKEGSFAQDIIVLQLSLLSFGSSDLKCASRLRSFNNDFTNYSNLGLVN